MTLAPGTRLGPYQIVDELGDGGMGASSPAVSRVGNRLVFTRDVHDTNICPGARRCVMNNGMAGALEDFYADLYRGTLACFSCAAEARR